ncbi:type I restriction enzyme endonuclease domain-containing protein [Natronospora cellulosivora (SeqCode)]
MHIDYRCLSRESVRAKMRVNVKILLRKYGYPPRPLKLSWNRLS